MRTRPAPSDPPAGGGGGRAGSKHAAWGRWGRWGPRRACRGPTNGVRAEGIGDRARERPGTVTDRRPGRGAPRPTIAMAAPHADDQRPPARELLAAFGRLVSQWGWQRDVIVQSQPIGASAPLPIVALRSPHTGPALWLLAGIHGEEPAGPAALAALVDELGALGRSMPIVMLPLCNPHGYARNWRYLNSPTWAEGSNACSVGDASHVLPGCGGAAQPVSPRSPRASSPEACAICRYVLSLSATFPPHVTLDLHEDSLIAAGYVYSQGQRGISEPLALDAVGALSECGVTVQRDGSTRFGEVIVDGVVGPEEDSSIDELLSASVVVLDGVESPGPAAPVVLVFETPTAAPLEQRVAVHANVVRRLASTLATGNIRRGGSSVRLSQVSAHLAGGVRLGNCAGEQTAPVSAPSNFLPVPLVRQATSYTCGVAAAMSVYNFWTGKDAREDRLATRLGATPAAGTAHQRIARFLTEEGLSVQTMKGMTLQQLRGCIDEGSVVIVALQAWASRALDHAAWAANWSDGHYNVVVGVDNRSVFLMDPSTLGSYAYIPIDEFLARWHDIAGPDPYPKGEICDQLGLVVRPVDGVRDNCPRAALPTFKYEA